MKKIASIAIIALVFLFSCKKSELATYTGGSRICFQQASSFYTPYVGSYADKVKLDFFPKNTLITTDTIKLKVQIIGETSAQDRPFDIEITGDNLVEGIDYSLPAKGQPLAANAYSQIYPLVIYRTQRLVSQTVVFKASLKANEQFQLGPSADTLTYKGLSGAANVNSLTVFASDIVLKPDNWDSFIKTYFLDYSQVKMRFIVDALNKTTFPTLSTSASSMRTYKARLQTALKTYNSSHPTPLTDENGVLIAF